MALVHRLVKRIFKAHRHHQAVAGGGCEVQCLPIGRRDVFSSPEPLGKSSTERDFRAGKDAGDAAQQIKLGGEPVGAPVPPGKR